MQRARLILLLIVFCSLLFSSSCSRSRPPAQPNVVVIVLDTVRRDYTGLARNNHGLGSFTPHLDQLAADGTAFVNAYTNAPWTVPSHASLFTGVLPSVHGCTSRTLRLEAERPTLAEAFSHAGYETVSFYGNPLLDDQVTGLLRGFEQKVPGFNRDMPNVMEIGDQGGFKTLANIHKWMAKRRKDKPFFMFVNILEPHLPYDPPPDYRGHVLSDLPGSDVISVKWGHEFNAGLHASDNVDWRRIRRLYGGDVHTADQLLGEIIQLLRQDGYYDNSSIIVTSDHGENLGEHNLIEHQFCIYETLLAVPLVIRSPDILNRGIRRDPVTLADVYDMALYLAGLPGKLDTDHHDNSITNGFPKSRALVAEYTGVTPSHLEHLRSLNPKIETEKIGAAYISVRRDHMRFTLGSDGSRALHNLDDDPLQLVDLSSANASLANELYDYVMRCSASILEPGGVTAKPLDEKQNKRLRSLGYIR